MSSHFRNIEGTMIQTANRSGSNDCAIVFNEFTSMGGNKTLIGSQTTTSCCGWNGVSCIDVEDVWWY
jgi:hypothetical protein